jgi:hypothetical protein
LPEGEIKTMDFGTGEGCKAEAWRNIWGSGRGSGAIRNVSRRRTMSAVWPPNMRKKAQLSGRPLIAGARSGRAAADVERDGEALTGDERPGAVMKEAREQHQPARLRLDRGERPERETKMRGRSPKL